MKSVYSFIRKPDFLAMSISGTYDYWDFIKYPKIINKKCVSEQVYKVLVDVVPVTYTEIPTIELFFLGETLAEIFRDRVKMALVWDGQQQDNLLEIVATNRAANLKVFKKVRPAEYWLLFDKEDEPSNLFKQ